MVEDAICPLCGDEVESMSHVLCWCPKARAVWNRICPFDFIKCELNMEFRDWIGYLLDHCIVPKSLANKETTVASVLSFIVKFHSAREVSSVAQATTPRIA